MTTGNNMAAVARLIGDPARANMLDAMLDARAHSAGELATIAGVSAATASGHLRQLLDGGLVAVAAQGRHRYYRLASPEVARLLEGLMAVTAPLVTRHRATPRVPNALREARTCYDHLAGRLGIAITDTLVANGAVRIDDNNIAVTDHGRVWLGELAIDLDAPRGWARRPLCRPCLDWSERRPHLAGVLGAALLERLLDRGWIARVDGSRAIRVTPPGAAELRRRFGYEPG
ncbi:MULTISPECIES: helix-turn-helix transcriptional regulator [unclassified Sphingomonas]|uniref:ArsR/SmtB family transcription factor n=1 Tax=unclassified Sphingomonas TaxID=196159 RepID=UPI000928E3D1|nr:MULTISPECIES: helix-turn-helix transcriptional regulator [unclassified Sphingomonas]OJU17816.1 MAG: transcriptional regulator [Sphingomonas sp. 66-10]